ncbi:F-box protein At1g67340-like [Phragmites australis]|uniref:F-box protein At1g67340-like n=1 Tax=Phragmites australis TaxID=29695 RepID=UPI002D767951|nr:F-box protein At1g67340-like [Phragmites australis]
MRKPARRSNSNKWRRGGSEKAVPPAKQRLLLLVGHGGVDSFDRLPDDLVLAVLAGLAARAPCPADLAAAALTCRRLRELAAHPAVLSQASAAAVAVRAGSWSEAAHRFLRRCAAAGNLHACYFLGMVRFYCLGARATGAALLARAAAGGHPAALYALAVVQFNGSGGDKADKDPRAGVTLCARAAWLGHAPALRELGHCLQDGYGARRDAAAGRCLLLHAAAREILSSHCRGTGAICGHCAEDDAASRFMVEWWALTGKSAAAAAREGDGESDDTDLRLCSHARCGRRETRRHEFRRCSVCGSANYCSRACQALHWKRVHRGQCTAAAAGWLVAGDAH